MKNLAMRTEPHSLGKALGKIRKKYAEVRALHKCQQQLNADAAAISKWFANMTAAEIERVYELD